MSKKTCLITGVGPGTGTALVKRFLEGGYQVAMIARSAKHMEKLSQQNSDAHAFLCDVAKEDQIVKTLEAVREKLGSVDVLIHNAVAAEFGDFLSVDPVHMQTAFDINTMALLILARLVTPDMIKSGAGAIVATGNTAAYRGKETFATYAPTKAAQRILLESIARQVGPKGIHAAYVAVDAMIDVPWVREKLPDKPDDYFSLSNEVADEVHHIVHQPRSCWAFDVIVRPYGES